MTTEDFISELFYRVDETMKGVPKHPLASLWPSEIVTLGVLFALKGVGNRVQGQIQSPLDRRGQLVLAAQSLGVGGGLGLCWRECPR